MMDRLEKIFESFLFSSRWLLAPFYVGLIGAVAILLYKFIKEFIHLVVHLPGLEESDIVFGVLSLIDISLLANLLIIITFSGYESFVSKIDVADHEDKPSWMGKVGFTALKMKLISSIVAISAIELLKVFVNIADYSNDQVMWKVIIHMTFVVSGVLFAVMDRTAPTHH